MSESMVQMNTEVRPYLDLIDKLRAVGIEKDLPIPQIAVMGDQSSGKSSVLEALSGVQFPRGAGLVTKCATELRMKNRPNMPWSAEISLTWGYPQPKDAGVVTNPEELGPRIERLTEALLQARGKNATFESEHSILIELMSPDVPDLTLIDLPGIVRTTLEGQSKTVVADVDALLHRYLQQSRTIILAVIPSNVDIATVDIIERASKADPEGVRTVGVLTKPDMIGEGAEQEKVDTLLNVTKPLKLGYLMVKNRSQKQIDEGVSLNDAKQLELSWFRSHDHFRQLEESYFGVDNLARKLTYILVGRIKDSIPHMSREIKQLQEKTQLELETLGASPPGSAEERRDALGEWIRKVTNEIDNTIKGNYDSELLRVNRDVRVLARFRAFASAFNELVLKDTPKWTVEQIKAEIKDSRGRELAGFPKFSVFEHLVHSFVIRWKQFAHDLLTTTKDMAAEACDTIVEQHVHQFRRFTGALRTHLQDLLSTRAQLARTGELEALIANELAPMTENHYFMELYNKYRMETFAETIENVFHEYNHVNSMSQDQLTHLRENIIKEYNAKNTLGTESNQTQEAKDLHAMLHAYWKTASKRFIDSAVSIVLRVLLTGLGDEAIKRFGATSISAEQINEFFSEDQGVQETRNRLKAKAERLKSAYVLVVEKGI